MLEQTEEKSSLARQEKQRRARVPRGGIVWFRFIFAFTMAASYGSFYAYHPGCFSRLALRLPLVEINSYESGLITSLTKSVITEVWRYLALEPAGSCPFKREAPGCQPHYVPSWSTGAATLPTSPTISEIQRCVNCNHRTFPPRGGPCDQDQRGGSIKSTEEVGLVALGEGRQRFSPSSPLPSHNPAFNMAMPEPIGLREPKYLPEEINIWMYAIVAIGSTFLVFVIISVYLMCNTPEEPPSYAVSTSRRLPQHLVKHVISHP
ncbi:uncharacterized protein [Procambarus clarkii]|uniref:uncharacterized protein n=1 Tax=Procambarus clarkii TaxID=6728 RepID=UPI0037423AAC